MNEELEQLVATELEFSTEQTYVGGGIDKFSDIIAKDNSTNTTSNSQLPEKQEKSEQERKVDESSHGSNKTSFGKFKTADELLKAYSALESEFTKKCQALVQAQSIGDNPQGPSVPTTKQVLEEYFSTHALAKAFMNDITEKVSNVESGKLPAALDKAYLEVLENNHTTPTELVQSQEFLSNYVFSDKNLCGRIVENYVNEVRKGESPQTIGRGFSSNISLTPKTNPATISEAGKLAKYIIKRK